MNKLTETKKPFLSVISILLAILSFLSLSTYSRMLMKEDLNLPYLLYFWLTFALLGLIIGLVDLIKSKKKKILAWCSTILNIFIIVLPFLFYVLLWAIRLAETSS